jgi:K+-transporting ATPase ATPase C chain
MKTWLQEFRTALAALVLLSLLTGVAYPLALTALAQLGWPEAANGSLVTVQGVVRGSLHVGQAWDGECWFHGRPSATAPAPYHPWPSSGSNLGPLNGELAVAFEQRAAELVAQGAALPLPVDLLTSSASGLDPHLSPAGAQAQVNRVARARGLEPARVRALVEEQVRGRWWGVFGEPTVNVLLLNLALERLE